jgi:hypothetical protein
MRLSDGCCSSRHGASIATVPKLPCHWPPGNSEPAHGVSSIFPVAHPSALILGDAPTPPVLPSPICAATRLGRALLSLAAGVHNIQCPFFLDTLFLFTYPDSVRNKIPISQR